jgi:alanyl-tRNA synthetase
VAVVFSGCDAEGYSYCLMERGGDLRSLNKAMTAALSGRGGGKPEYQQGSVKADKAAIEGFFRENWK